LQHLLLNTAVGFNALESTTGSFNTAVGDGALAGNDHEAVKIRNNVAAAK